MKKLLLIVALIAGFFGTQAVSAQSLPSGALTGTVILKNFERGSDAFAFAHGNSSSLTATCLPEEDNDGDDITVGNEYTYAFNQSTGVLYRSTNGAAYQSLTTIESALRSTYAAFFDGNYYRLYSFSGTSFSLLAKDGNVATYSE